MLSLGSDNMKMLCRKNIIESCAKFLIEYRGYDEYVSDAYEIMECVVDRINMNDLLENPIIFKDYEICLDSDVVLILKDGLIFKGFYSCDIMKIRVVFDDTLIIQVCDEVICYSFISDKILIV